MILVSNYFNRSKPVFIGSNPDYPPWRVGLPIGVPFDIPDSIPADAVGMGSGWGADALTAFCGLATDIDNLASYSIANGGHEASKHQIGAYKYNWFTGLWSLVMADPAYTFNNGPYYDNGITTDDHSYYSQFIAILDDVPTWIRIYHGAYANTSGNSNITVNTFDTDTLLFNPPNGTPWGPVPDTRFGTADGSAEIAGPCAAQDPVTKYIWTLRPIGFAGSGGFGYLNPFTRAWTLAARTDHVYTGALGSCIDVTRGFFMVGGFFGQTDYVGEYRLSDDNWSPQQLNGPGVSDFSAGRGAASLMHSLDVDKYFHLQANGKLLRIDPDSKYTELYTTCTASGATSPYSRAMILPSLRGIGWVAGYNTPVQFIPLAA